MATLCVTTWIICMLSEKLLAYDMGQQITHSIQKLVIKSRKLSIIDGLHQTEDMVLEECYKGGGIRGRQSLRLMVVWRGVRFRQILPLSGRSRDSLGLRAAVETAEWEKVHKSSGAVVKGKVVTDHRCAYTVQKVLPGVLCEASGGLLKAWHGVITQ